jgi:hypothetical protein
VALPDLVAELARLVSDRHHDITGFRGKVIGSPAPLQIPVVHLAHGGMHRPAWWGEDPRQPRWALTWYDRAKDERTAHTTLHSTEDAAWRAFHRVTGLPAPLEVHQLALVRITRWRAQDQYGAAPLLETWVRVLTDELVDQFGPAAFPDLTEQATVRSEAATLIEHWSFITEQRWAEDLAQDVGALTAQVKAALGVPKEEKYACPECGNPAYIVPGGILSCQEGHERVVRDLEMQQRRRPAMSTKDTCAEFDLTETQLWQWKHRRKITPTKDERGRLWWWPWDVFCLLNPDIADAIRLRDEMTEDDQEEAEHAVP